MSLRKAVTRYTQTPLPPVPDDLAGWRWVRHEHSAEIALAAPGQEYTTKWYLKDFDRAGAEARRWLLSQPRPLPADLPPVPNDLPGWAWEASPGGTIRLALACVGLASVWTTPDAAGDLIAGARQIVAQEAERTAAALAALDEEAAIVVEPAAFDYAALSAEARIVVQQAAKEIRDEFDRMRQSAIKIGRRLADVRDALPHGSWEVWLRSEFDWTPQTARNYIRQAELGAQNEKFLRFEDRIEPSAMGLLAAPSTPEPARQEAIRRAEAGETVRHRDAKEIVQAAKAEQAEAAPALAPQRPSDEEQAALKAIVRSLGGSWFGIVSQAGAQSRYRVAFHRERADNYTAAQIRARAASAAPAAAPPTAVEVLDQVGRQPYGTKGADRWQPIVPHVLILGERSAYYTPPELIRAETIYDTPTTVRLRRPDGKEETQAQHKIWCVPDDAAWEWLSQAVAAFGEALTDYARALRRLGRYAERLHDNGGLREIPTGPLCPSVARAEDPDHTYHSTWGLVHWMVPSIERTAICRHTQKMLEKFDSGGYVFSQNGCFVLEDDAAWETINAAREAAVVAASVVEDVLRRLGTYEEALRDGRHQRPAGAPPAEVYEAAVAAFAQRGYVLSCKAVPGQAPGCPPYWLQRPSGRGDLPNTRGAGTWSEVEALLAEISAAPAPAAEQLTVAELQILSSMEVGPPYWHRNPANDTPPLIAMVNGNAPAQRALRTVEAWRALADERAALIRLARRLGVVVFGTDADGLLRVRLDPDADEPQIAIALAELESLNLPDGWRWCDHADTTLQPERIADGHLGPIVGSLEEGGHYAYNTAPPGAMAADAEPDGELPSESDLDAQLLAAMDTILHGLPEPAVRVLAAQLCFDDVSDIAFSAPLERLYEGFRDVAKGATIASSLAYRRDAAATIAQLGEAA